MIDLQPFCYPDDIRPWITTPFRQNGKIYATDGSIAIEINDDGREIDRGDLPHAPDMRVPFQEYRPRDGWKSKPVPARMPRMISCPECDGTGIATYECSCDCGEISHTVTCECSHCDNGKVVEILPCVTVLGKRFNQRYVALIMDLPDVEYAICDIGLCFRFTGGRGIVGEIETL